MNDAAVPFGDRYRDALSPLDGRYREALTPLRGWFSEAALVRERVRVEVLHAIALDDVDVFPKLDAGERERLHAVSDRFDDESFTTIKRIEGELRHDVKACEVFLRERTGLRNPNRIHFGLTSEDVNNLAYGLALRGYAKGVAEPLSRGLLTDLVDVAERWKAAPFPCRTHGQAATPSTAGKEIAVFIGRFLRVHEALTKHRFYGKLNGATGGYAAMKVAAPGVDWRAYEQRFVTSLGLERNPATTQIEDHQSFGAYFDLVRSQANIAVDLCQDAWLYISYGYLKQRTVAGEVGSSTMPHKVNPIRFENAEGNLQVGAALLSFLSDKLSRSRMQRDLSDSTVLRNIGVALGHVHLALGELRAGLSRVELDHARCDEELAAHPEVLAEAVQMVLRLTRADDVYSELKALTRGKELTQSDYEALVAKLADEPRAALSGLTPRRYVGDAERVCDEVIAMARAAL